MRKSANVFAPSGLSAERSQKATFTTSETWPYMRVEALRPGTYGVKTGTYALLLRSMSTLKCSGSVFARTRRLIISTNTENPIAK